METLDAAAHDIKCRFAAMRGTNGSISAFRTDEAPVPCFDCRISLHAGGQ